MTRTGRLRIRDGLAVAGGVLCGALAVTGGWTIGFEMVSLAPWVVVWGVALGFSPALRTWFSAQTSRVSRLATPRRCMVFLAAFGGLLFSVHGVRHWSFATHLYDHLCVVQGLWHPWTDGLPPLWCSPCRSETYFGEHFSPSLFLVAPLVAPFRGFWWRDLAVFGFQIALLAGGTAWLLAKGPLGDRTLRNRWWIALGCTVCSVAWRFGGTWDFREDHLAFLGFSLLVTGLYRRRAVWVVLGAALAYFSKENMALIGLGVAVPVAWHLKRPRLALAWALGSVAVTVLIFKLLWPALAPVVLHSTNIADRLAPLGTTPLEIVTSVFTRPDAWLRLIVDRFSVTTFKYLVLHLLPFVPALLWPASGDVPQDRRRALLWLVPVAVGMAMNVSSGMPNQLKQEFHYDLGHLAFLIFALQLGIASWPSAQVPRRAWACLFLALLASGRWPGWYLRQFWPSAAQVAEARRLGSLETQQPIQDDANRLPHLSHLRSSLRRER